MSNSKLMKEEELSIVSDEHGEYEYLNLVQQIIDSGKVKQDRTGEIFLTNFKLVLVVFHCILAVLANHFYF